jgi:hypothetical protein
MGGRAWFVDNLNDQCARQGALGLTTHDREEFMICVDLVVVNADRGIGALLQRLDDGAMGADDHTHAVLGHPQLRRHMVAMLSMEEVLLLHLGGSRRYGCR